ncbi:SGNH/GDSL hydrolase family protein [Clostridium botulinum]|uniref:SGNH/GDSL hydrolase family protein n=1 Tax=Clostridium botulinum TaxID=1491 RepID=UPI001A90D81F|nr:SGNH/GDSL hydrolase family protein [Clostridium botulinum]MBO0523307.1 SGNH/GDSL hydrolase family protein [Clostridium botulinum]MBO0529885.1 SGNH/GDSL hydrolase family protein [Clostridium botulinum]MBO0533153.1 SGNH/GDSL hydrolase family protein [Clostridium botulinum]MBO0536970.1 SGNH/GDSL hydrolase family protein [Clostridium botulinum]MBO0538645.1 SGNH/GDSL hydrolase family protein [Clostridium botulinum]
MKDSKYNIAIFFLIVIFIALIVVGTMRDKKNYASRKVNKSVQIINKNKQSSKKDDKEINKNNKEPENLYLYEKINNKKEITMLSIGDDMANSSSIEEKDKWHNNIKKYIEDTYKIKVDTKVIWKEKSKIDEALDNYKKSETKNYDLIFITLGEYNIGYEPTEKLASRYEELIKEIIKNNSKSDLYLIVQSSIRLDKNYPEAIIKIANHYNLNIVDMRKAFKNSNENYITLTTDGILPNKKGYNLYTKEIIKSLEKNIKSQKVIKYAEKQVLYKTK